MGLPPLDERALAVLKEELKRLEATYQKCAEIFGPNPSGDAAEALRRINGAMEAIGKEVAARSGG